MNLAVNARDAMPTGSRLTVETDTMVLAKAFTMAEDRNWAIHWLLTDVVMPGGSGPDVADRLKEQYPNLKILYMFGYPGPAKAHQGILESGRSELQKPRSPDALLREALDEPRRRKT